MLKQIEIYDNKDSLGITSGEAISNNLKERAYITQAEWDTLLAIDIEFVQDCILDILEDEIRTRTSKDYLEYKEKVKNILCANLNKTGAEMVKTTYLNTKTFTVRTRCILEVLDEIIYTNA